MADNNTSIFGDLYDYVDANGTVLRIPDASDLRDNVAAGFKRIFGPDFSTDPETPNGLLIDALALGLFDAIGICAQNVNGLNLDLATGRQLDTVGSLFGVSRQTMDDADYRSAIRNSIGKGVGLYSGVVSSLNENTDVKDFCVLENNRGYAMALPQGEPNAVVVKPHSIYISIIPNDGYDTKFIANSIVRSKAPGCDYNGDDRSLQVVTEQMKGPTSTSLEDVVFNIAKPIGAVDVSVTMDASTYRGTNIESDVSSAVLSAVMSRPICNVVTKQDIVAAIASAGLGTASGVSFKVNNATVESILVHPYECVVESDVSVTVEV